MNSKIYIVLAASAILLSGLFLLPAIQQPIQKVNAQSAFNAYLTLDGIQGSSSQSPNAIDILSWSWGATQVSNIGSQSSGAGAGKVSMSSFSIMKAIDKASPQLYSLAASGKRIKSAVIIVNSGGAEYLKIQMSDVLVSSYGLSSSGGDRPTESVSFNFSKVVFTYDLKSAK